MLKSLIKLESTINGTVAHLFVEMGLQPMTTNTIAEYCLDFIKQLGAIEAQNKAQAEAQAATQQAQVQTEAAPETTEAPAPVEAPCCQAGESCADTQQAG